MNFQTAAIVAASTGVLSFLFGLIGGVPFFDMVLRALFWAAAGFGGCLGVETLLRRLVPEVFDAAPPAAPSEAGPERAVDIVLDEEGPGPAGFVEEADDDGEPIRRTPAPVMSVAVDTAAADMEPAEGGAAASSISADGAPGSGAGEALPEMGAFLDAFKPGASGDEEPPPAASPDYGDYSPAASSPQPYAPQEAFMDGEPQDPAELARAVQTILKRDSQGN
jgi:hypothetical protein